MYILFTVSDFSLREEFQIIWPIVWIFRYLEYFSHDYHKHSDLCVTRQQQMPVQ